MSDSYSLRFIWAGGPAPAPSPSCARHHLYRCVTMPVMLVRFLRDIATSD